jgi:hypothetical protein
VSISVTPVMIIQSVFAVLQPSRGQKLRDIEIEFVSDFKPLYFESLTRKKSKSPTDTFAGERRLMPTVWGESHSFLQAVAHPLPQRMLFIVNASCDDDHISYSFPEFTP